MLDAPLQVALHDPNSLASKAAVENYICTSMMALILWEHAITFRSEFFLMWRRNFSVITVLFVVNRYGAISYGIIGIAAAYAKDEAVRQLFLLYLSLLTRNFSSEVCHAKTPRPCCCALTVYFSCAFVTRANDVVTSLLELTFGVCSAVRAYAVWNKNMLPSIIILALNLGPLGSNIYLYNFTTPIATHVALPVCVSYLNLGVRQELL
ncbi:hypothetical protein PsYK624_123850 [Phanerochaete sordida]|uniref:DUF6533 domain-containing protein n=1 Tax=Phanerochaete sordida TaxID=48140 RepID=A0A9P3LJG3_9APHY|nr:hypothetical protein PsYK624_123850 [Phanerochaete sordida]